MTTPTGESCRDCRYSYGANLSARDWKKVATMKCRRYPPRKTDSERYRENGQWHVKLYPVWPSVRNDSWCGEFAPHP